MLGIPYRVHQLQRMSRNQRGRLGNSVSARDFGIFISETNTGPPLLMQRMSGWSFGSKIMAATAGFILVLGVILTLLTMNSSLLQLSAYRPIIFTILGILFIIIGPMLACRMVLNAYDRRLAREQRQFEYFVQQMRRRETGANSRSQSAQTNSPRNRAQLAVDYLLNVAGVSTQGNRTRQDPSALFPGKLPSYDSALDLKENPHWSRKFFDYEKDPPPPYQNVIEMDTIRVHSSANAQETDNSQPSAQPLMADSGISEENSEQTHTRTS